MGLDWMATTTYSIKPGAPCFFCEAPHTVIMIKITTEYFNTYQEEVTVPCCRVCRKKMKLRFWLITIIYLTLLITYIKIFSNVFLVPFLIFLIFPGIYMIIQNDFRKRKFIDYAAKYFVPIDHKYTKF